MVSLHVFPFLSYILVFIVIYKRFSPITFIIVKMNIFPQDGFLSFIKKNRFICINLHCISLTWHWSVLSITHTSATRSLPTEALKSVPLPYSFSSLLNNGAPHNKSLMFPKCNLFSSGKCQRVLFCVLSFSPVNRELHKEKYSYVDQLPVSEIIHQVKDSYRHQGQFGTAKPQKQACIDVI